MFSPTAVAGGTVTLGEGSVVVGREPDGERSLKLDDSQVSRSHARLERDGDGWRIVDLRSRNGIYVDGERTAEAALRHGTIVRIGRSLMVFVEVAVPAGARLEPETKSLWGQSAAMQMSAASSPPRRRETFPCSSWERRESARSARPKRFTA